MEQNHFCMRCTAWSIVGQTPCGVDEPLFGECGDVSERLAARSGVGVIAGLG